MRQLERFGLSCTSPFGHVEHKQIPLLKRRGQIAHSRDTLGRDCGVDPSSFSANHVPPKVRVDRAMRAVQSSDGPPRWVCDRNDEVRDEMPVNQRSIRIELSPEKAAIVSETRLPRSTVYSSAPTKQA